MEEWEDLIHDINECGRCTLCRTALKRVPGGGDKNAGLMLIGEGPGEQDDLLGIPFMGLAGQFLDKMIEAMGLSRKELFVTNVVKCRPPYNRTPSGGEIEACLPFLRREVRLVKPEMIITLGRTAARSVIDPSININTDHGKVYERKGFWMMPTYHPSALLRDASKKRPCWEDLKKIMAKMSASPDRSPADDISALR